jgi:prepilin-type N-terminal cleavage/methylation domain-containing protein
MNKNKINRGFNLIEILVSVALLAIIFSFIFYFLSSIHYKKVGEVTMPYLMHQYGYSEKYCRIEEGRLATMGVFQDIDMSPYVSTSTPITSMHVFDKNKLLITANSASTTEPDIFLFDRQGMRLLQSVNVGPGINDSLLHGSMLYALNTSVNSHVKTLKIGPDTSSLLEVGDIKIGQLSSSGALPKRIYLFENNLLVGTEKNSTGGEFFVLPLNLSALPTMPSKSLEIGGQVSGIYGNQDRIYLANASDTELFVYDMNFNLSFSYDAPLSLGNGKSVFYLDPYVYLGRTVASFELHLLKMKDAMLSLIGTHKAYGTVDFIQALDIGILVISSSQDKELQFFTHDLQPLKTFNLPARVGAYACPEEGFLFAVSINNQSHILWLQ